MAITTAIFDAYGTLFDVNAAARVAASEPGCEALAEVWPQLAMHWRAKQLEYTWLRAVADRHTDFWTVTQDGLDWAMEACALTDPALRQRLLDLYQELAAYPEVKALLARLQANGVATGILSNGAPDMLRSAVTSAGLSEDLDAVLSVEDVGVFKPHARVYDMVGQRFGTTPDQVLFVSSNGWDIAGASGYGFTTAWVNRAGLPQDRLFAAPDHVMADLTTIPELI